jgi:hypothetical protein
MSQLDDLIKSIKKGNYEKALSKKKSANVIAKEAKSDIEKKTDKLKERRVYDEEMQKSSPEYKETKVKETEAKRIKADTNLKKAKKDSKGPTPQEDMLRFGQEQKKFRDLAFKERTVEEEDDEGNTTVSMQYIPREGNELFKQQVEAYGDSLRLASLAQQYGTRTPDIRKIDKNRNAITQERNELTKKLMSQEFPLVPGPDGTYTRISDEEKMKTSMERANDMLVQKYGKGIIPLLTALANR